MRGGVAQTSRPYPTHTRHRRRAAVVAATASSAHVSSLGSTTCLTSGNRILRGVGGGAPGRCGVRGGESAPAQEKRGTYLVGHYHMYVGDSADYLKPGRVGEKGGGGGHGRVP